MKNEIEGKLSRIADIWNYYIWDYRECNKHIKFTKEARTNYFGDILGYFKDTFDIVFEVRESKSLSDTFSNNISLLQIIYVHQDFIEELLELFKCEINKGDLKKDENYTINRDLRNELIGHPFRKQKGKFISSTVFSYHPKPGNLEYLRYHVDNNYKFESVSYDISEIRNRHNIFMNTYLDKILEKLKIILFDFINNIERIESLVETLNFDILIKVLAVKFESLFGNKSYLYEKEELIIIFNKRNDHLRYQNLIDKFYSDLKSTLKESKSTIIEYYADKKTIEQKPFVKPIIKFVDMSNKRTSKTPEKPIERSYHYELGKLSEGKDFDFHFKCMSDVYDTNKDAAIELDNMKNNRNNNVEYYCSYYLLRKIIKN